MTTYEFKYQLISAPEARADGSGQIAHDIQAVMREEGSGDAFVVVPGHHVTILIPASELVTVLALPDNTGAQRNIKNTAYKSALLANRASTPLSNTSDWSSSGLQNFLDANDLASETAVGVNAYITVTLGQEYPVNFSI